MIPQPATGNETARLESFSDGVFAIAITLLVFQIHVPTRDEVLNDGLLKALADLWPSYLALTISFLNILLIWMNHHVIFRVINRNTLTLFLFNGLLLLSIVFAPFPTNVFAQHIKGTDSHVAAAVFAGWFAIIALTLNLIWWYAVIGARLLLTDINPALVRTISWRYSIAAMGYVLASGLALVSTALGAGLCLAVACLYIVPIGGDDVYRLGSARSTN